MRFLIDLFLALVLVVAFFFGLGFMLPSTAHVERSILIERPPIHVFDMVNNLARFPEWSALTSLDPNVKFLPSAQLKGPGAQMGWESQLPKVGNGYIEIVGGEDLKGVGYKLYLSAQNQGSSRMIVAPQEFGVKATWGFDVDFGSNVIQRYKGLYLDAAVGDTLHLSMLRLKYLLENNAYARDYSDIEIEEKVLTAMPALQITATAKCYAEAGEDTCTPDVPTERAAALKEINDFIARNKLTTTGSPQFMLVSKEPYTVTFDVLVPVDRNDVKLAGRLQAVQTYAGKVIMGMHEGFRDNTVPTWEKVMAYMTVHGLKPVEGVPGRQIDEYVSDPATTEAQFFHTNVYQPVQ